MIKSFRGQIAHAEVETIRLSTNNGLTGYRIKKFQVMALDANEDVENTVALYSVDPGTPTSTAVNFDDPTLLGAAMIWANINQVYVHESMIIFDNTTFNQDIFVSNYHDGASKGLNYYLELEQVKLDVGEAAVATLKDMRGRN